MTDVMNISISFGKGDISDYNHDYCYIIHTEFKNWTYSLVCDRNDNKHSAHFKIDKNITNFQFKVYCCQRNKWYFLDNYPKNNIDNNVFKITHIKGYYYNYDQLRSYFYSQEYDINVLTLEHKINEFEKKLVELKEELRAKKYKNIK